MPIRVVSANEIRAALPMSDAIHAMRVAFTELSLGRVEMPQRVAVPGPGDATMLLMSGRCAVRFGLGAKLVTVVPENAERGLPTIHGVVMVFDETNGVPLALLDGESLTAIRTGAASGLATALLANPQASSVALIGAGAQAWTQLEAVCAVRPIGTVRVFSRTRTRAEAFARDVRSARWFPSGADLVVTDTAAAAVSGVEIVCTATPATEPLFRVGDIDSGTHVNAVGSFRRGMQEIEPALLGEAFVVVDHRPAALAEAGEVIAAVERGIVSADALVEIGDVAAGRVATPASDRTTVFKSVGVAAQDLVAAARVVQTLGLGQPPGDE